MPWKRLLFESPWSRWIVPVSLAVAVLFVAINEASYYSARKSLDASVNSMAKRSKLRDVQRLVVEAETSQRGFMLTGNADYRVPYDTNRARVPDVVKALNALYADDPDASHRADVQRVGALLASKMSEMEQTMLYLDSGRRDRAFELMQAGLGLTAMQQLDSLLVRLIKDETGATNTVLNSLTEVLVLQRVGIAVLVLLTAMAVTLLTRLSARELAERERHRLALQVERDKLESEVKSRTRDLAILAEHLQNVREDERAYLARELHDELGGLLTAAKLDVARIKNRMQSPEHAALVTERMTHLVETLDAGIALKRRIIEDLRPSTLSNLGLTTALDVLCKDFASRSGWPVDTHIDEVDLPPNMQLTVYRLVQEALTNIAKYAEPSRVRVDLCVQDDWAQVSIEDNGTGFDSAVLRSGAHGLAGMRFRVAAHGGELSVTSAPGAGSRIWARLPQSEEGIEAGVDAPTLPPLPPLPPVQTATPNPPSGARS